MPGEVVMPSSCCRKYRHNTDGFNSLKDIGALTIHGEQITVPYNSQTGLPLIRTVPGTKMFQAFTAETLSATDQSMIHGNLINLQWVKLILHERCNHVSFKQLNSWICQNLPRFAVG